MSLDYSHYRESKLERLSRSKTITSEQCEMIYNLQDDAFLEGLARNPFADVRILEKLYNDLKNDSYEDSVVLMPLMYNPSLPHSIMEEAVVSSDRYISKWVALNPALDALMVETLRARNENSIYISLCNNPHLDSNILRELYYRLRYEQEDFIPLFARNVSTPVDVLSQIVEEGIYPENSFNALLMNPSLTTDIINKLFTQHSPTDLVALARHAPTPIVDMLYHSLQKGENIGQRNRRLWVGIGRNKNTNPSILEEMHHSGDALYAPNVLAGNPSTPTYILEELAHTTKRDVLNSLAMNPAITQKIVLDIDWMKLSRVPLGRVANCQHATAERVKATFLAIDETSELQVEENLMRSPLAEIEDIIHALRATTGFKDTPLGLLFDREEFLYPKLVGFMKSEYNVDITTMPDSLVLQLLDIDYE
jgi:hypothetical protein